MMFERKISSSMLERKCQQYPVHFKSIDENGRFAGYASVFNVIDNQRDIILPGAFRDTLKGRSSEIRLLWQHRMDEPIGYFDAVFEDNKGLYVEGRLLLEVQRAGEAYALLKAQAIRGLSIGYSPLRYTIDPDSGARVLSQVELWEISLVTFPANEAAGITVVKSSHANEEYLPQHLIALSDALDAAIHTLKKA